MSRGTCSDCGAAVMWARTIPGRAMMPLDPRPYPDDDARANYARVPMASGDYCRALSTAEPFEPAIGERRMMPHAATCAARRPDPVPHWTDDGDDDDDD